jgi:hypothetical protein
VVSRAPAAEPIDNARCEALAALAVKGDAAAARALIELLWPHWVRLAQARPSLRRSSSPEDAAHEVATRLAEKLGRPGSRELALYPLWKERNAGKSFEDWVRICTANVARDLARSQLGPAPAAPEPPASDGPPGVSPLPGGISMKRLLNELARSLPLDDVGVRPPVTAAQTARQLLEFARAHLPEPQLRALSLWLEGEDFGEIAAALSLPGALAAQRTVRAALAVLRRRFAG